MNTQIYLLLVRKVNPHLPAPAKAAQIVKNFVLGDSLDAPFLKFIRVQSMSHKIGFGGGDKVTRVNPQTNQAETLWTSDHTAIGDYAQRKSLAGQRVGGVQHRANSPAYADRWIADTRNPRLGNPYSGFGNAAKGIFTTFKNNQYVNVSLPDHDDLTFAKNVDNATPQLAYGCTAQEPFSFAAFFFRRRIGAGIRGVRIPFLTLVLEQCLISGWELADETEKVTLNYKKIAWATFDQVADINAPTGLSARVWDTQEKAGGEKPEAYIPQAIITLLMAGVGVGVDMGTDEGVESG